MKIWKYAENYMQNIKLGPFEYLQNQTALSIKTITLKQCYSVSKFWTIKKFLSLRQNSFYKILIINIINYIYKIHLFKTMFIYFWV